MTTMAIERTQGAPVLPSPIRAALAAVWQDLLDRRPAGSDDFFRDHRGNRIECLELLLEVRRRFGVEVTMRAFAEDSTFDGLVRIITAALK